MIAKYIRSKLKHILAEDVERICLYQSHSDPQMMASPILLSELRYPITLASLLEHIIAVFPSIQPYYHMYVVADFRMTEARQQKIAKFHQQKRRLSQKLEQLIHKKDALVHKLNRDASANPMPNRFVSLDKVTDNTNFTSLVQRREYIADLEDRITQIRLSQIRHISDVHLKTQWIWITPIDMS